MLIDVPDEDVVRRISGRRMCVKSGHNYHVEFDPPKRDEVCDQDGSRLIQRDDDKPEVVAQPARRLPRSDRAADRVLRREGAAAANRRVADPADVHDHIRAVIATLRMEDDVEAGTP